MANPTISTITPNYGSILGGEYITFIGTNYAPGALVTFNGVLATNINVVSATQIICKTPASALGLVDVVITNTDLGTVTLSAGFQYIQPFLYHSIADVSGKFKNITFPVLNVAGNSNIVVLQSNVINYITQTEAVVTAALSKKYVLPATAALNPIAYAMIKKMCVAYTANDIYQIMKTSSVQSINPDDSAKIATFYYEAEGLLKRILNEEETFPDLQRLYAIKDVVQFSNGEGMVQPVSVSNTPVLPFINPPQNFSW